MKVKVKKIRQIIREQNFLIENENGSEDRFNKCVREISRSIDKLTDSAVKSGMSSDQFIALVKKLESAVTGLLSINASKVKFLSPLTKTSATTPKPIGQVK